MTQQLKPMTEKELADTQRVIVQAIHRHMPSAAIASGWASPVDVSGMVADAMKNHDHERVSEWGISYGFDGESAPSDLSVQAVRAYCAAHDLPTSDMFVKPFRTELIKSRMRAECNGNSAA